MKESSERKKGVILSYLSIILSTIVQLVYTPFLIRNLGQSEYGLYSLISSIIGYLTVLDLGFGNAIIVYTSRYRAQKKYDEEKKLHGMFKVVFYIIGGITAILGLILFFSISTIFKNTMTLYEIHRAKTMMLILTFNLVFTFSFSIYQSIITAYERFTFQKIMSIVNTLLKPLIMIPLLFLGFKSIAMTVILTCINIFILISNYLYCKSKLHVNIKFYGFDKILFKTIFGYSIYIFLGVVVDKINWSVDQFILGAISGTAAVSIYSIAGQLNTLFINLSNALSGVFLPKMSKMITNKATKNELTEEMIKVGRLQYYIIFLLASSLVLFGYEFIIWWAGKDYAKSYYVALILILPVCFPLIQNLGISIMQAMNKYKFKAISTFIMAIVNVIISLFLAKLYGPIGSALGTAVAVVVCNIIIINIYYCRELKLNMIKFWKEILNMSFKFIVPVFVILGIMFIIRIQGIFGIIIYGLIYIITFSIISYLFVMNDYEKSLIDNICKKIRGEKNEENY